MRRFLATAVCVLLLGFWVWGQVPFIVEKLEITGNRHVPLTEILAVIPFTEGDTVDALVVGDAKEAIEGLGYFQKVEVDLDKVGEEDGTPKVVVRFKVVEYPVIEVIEIEGLPEPPSAKRGLIPYLLEWISRDIHVTADDVRSILEENGVKEGEVLNIKKLEKALRKVLDTLRDENDIATAQFTEVEPGAVLRLKLEILPVVRNVFEGLSTVPKEEAERLVDVPLGKVGKMSTIRESYFRLQRSVFFESVELLPALAPGGKGVILRWVLTERVLLPEPRELKRIELVGATAFPEEKIEELLGELPEGKVDNYAVLKALEEVFSYYVREGYIFVDLEPLGVEDGILKVKVLEGVISKIEIKGNTRTREFVIRRVLELKEGEVLTQARLFSAQQALRALGYFSVVNLEPRREDGGIVLTVTVKEIEKLGSVRGALSLSPETGGIVGNIQYTQRNLLGTANDLSLSLEHGITGESRTTWSARWTSYSIPVFDRLTLEGYHRYDGKRTLGGKLKLSYPLAYLLKLDLGLTSELRWKEGAPVPPRNLAELGLTYDSRDDPFFFPRRGILARGSVSKAGDFLPGVSYLSLRGELIGFRPVDFPWWDLRGALAERLLVSWGWDLPEDYLFELGGMNSVRGAAKPLKVDALVLLNSEFRLELAQGAHVALFWDLGYAPVLGELKTSVGLEIAARFMGTFVRIDLAWPNDRPWNWVPRFEFGWAPLF